MAGFTYDNLVTDIRNYTEVDSNVLTAAIVNRIIEDAEFKILRDVPIDAYKKQQIGNLVTGQTTINVPAKTLFVKGVLLIRLDIFNLIFFCIFNCCKLILVRPPN